MEDDNSVTMLDVLKEQEAFEENAEAVLGASDDKNCTYSNGYIKRQALYVCLTCCPQSVEDPSSRSGVCLACSLVCHDKHTFVELYTKRNFRCDCGGPKFKSKPCTFGGSRTDANTLNQYNQNFSGLYCTCHKPYPDPDATEPEDEMIQCIVCEDWFHSQHLDAEVPPPDQYSEMICQSCMADNDFLNDYHCYEVSTTCKIDDHTNADVTSNSPNTSADQLDGALADSISKNSMIIPGICKISSADKAITTEPMTTAFIADIRNDTLKAQMPYLENIGETTLSENVNLNLIDESTEQKKIKDVQEIENEENKEMDAQKNVQTKHEQVNLQENCFDNIQTPVEIMSPNITESNLVNLIHDKVDRSSVPEKGDLTSHNNVDPDTGAYGVSDKNVLEVHQDNRVIDPVKTIEEQSFINKDENEKYKIKMPISLENMPNCLAKTEIDESLGINMFVSAKTDLLKDSENLKNDATISDGLASNCNMVPDHSKKLAEIESADNGPKSISDSIDTFPKKYSIGEVSMATCDTGEYLAGKEINTDNKVKESSMPGTSQQSDQVVDKTSLGSDEKLNPENQISTENTFEVKDPILKSNPPSRENSSTVSNVIEQNTIYEKDQENYANDENLVGKKRKYVEDFINSNEQVKKNKRDVISHACIKPAACMRTNKSGASFWPSDWRSKLCSCTSCLDMYTEKKVSFLIDIEDTMTAYENLGKIKTENSSSQYEKGMEALSSLGHVQQINAITEYNKMKEKLLEFLKTFKDKKEVVKEEDIKGFFAGMRPKREPDGVYFYHKYLRKRLLSPHLEHKEATYSLHYCDPAQVRQLPPNPYPAPSTKSKERNTVWEGLPGSWKLEGRKNSEKRIPCGL